MIKRRKFVSILVLTLFLLAPAFNVSADYEFESIAPAAYLMEASTGRVLYEKDADTALNPASITKIMTLLLGFEALENGNVGWDDLVHISEKAWRTGGSTMFLEVGTKVPYGDIITGISVASANDGCVAIAEYLYGTEEAFVQQMNKRAQELGLTNTRFSNSHGLHAENHYMSARDIAVLSHYLIEHYPKILEIESMTEFTFDGRTQANRNPLLGVFPGADGLKTGWTEEAGYCLVGTAIQNDMRLISVVLNTTDETERLAASSELLNYGFREFELHKVVNAEEIIDEIDIKKGKEETLPVYIKEDVTVVVKKDQKDDIVLKSVIDNEDLTAPIEKDATVGSLEVRINDELLHKADLKAAEPVEKAGFFKLLFRSILNFFRSLFSKG
ncbi:MAG: D-alanyl-D-alanine carboxypeptidase family protein [Eubacteriales bacterium]|nr:D-alanyl-D-alanine carboxypeptidase family protein [Bacillota bacterium]